jgi:signal transduction histidine kinase
VTRADPLIETEREAAAEMAVSQLRHDLRNRLAAIRNAAFYIRRRTSALPGANDDARVPRFFDLIEQELELAANLLGARPLDERESSERTANVGDVIGMALASARVPVALSVDSQGADGWVVGDPLELSVAIRALIELACASCTSAPSIEFRGTNGGESFRLAITVRDAATRLLLVGGPAVFERRLATRIFERARATLACSDEGVFEITLRVSATSGAGTSP